MALYTTYGDVADYLNNASMAVETATLVGGNTSLATSALAGATSLSLVSATGFPASGTFLAYVLDGPNSETVSVTLAGTTLTLTGGSVTLAAHAAGVNVVSAGTQGCLADVVIRASRWVENYCKQGGDAGADRSLYAKSRTELLSGPSSFRAAFDRDGSLLLRPYHFPIQSVTSVAVQMGGQSSATIDTTYLLIPDGARTLWIPSPAVLTNAPSTSMIVGRWWPRNIGFVVTLVYSGGPCNGTTLAAVPDDLRQACQFVTSDLLAYRRNPTGAAEVRQGDYSQTARLRGDTSGDSILLIQAKHLLAPFAVQPGM